MPVSLLLVGNPARRRTRKARAKSRKAPSAKQLAARRKFAAMARARAGKRRAAKRTSVTVMRSNPVKRRRHVAKRSHAVARRRVRRNPISSASLRNVTSLLKTSATGAAGAIGVDVLMGLVQRYLPAAIATPNDSAGGVNYGYYAAKGALAVVASMGAAKVIGAATAARIAEGSLTVTLHGLMARLIAANMSSVPLGMYTGARLGNSPGGKVLNMNANRPLRGVGAYVSGAQRDAIVR